VALVACVISATNLCATDLPWHDVTGCFCGNPERTKMKKLHLSVALLLAMAIPAAAQTVEERLIAGLKDQGYVIVEQGYTFLGRLRIVVEDKSVHREIVVNPGTGEILRDYSVALSDMLPRSGTQVASDGNGGTSTTSSGTVVETATVAGVVTSGVTSTRTDFSSEITLSDPLISVAPGGN
jgi:hypothetical protein